jgi:hypothetical protein
MSSGSTQNRKNKPLRETLNSLFETQPGMHIILVYPHVNSLKQIYAHYIQRQLANSEIVLILSYYETVERIKKYLQYFENDGGEMINVDKYLSEGSLLIVNSRETFFNRRDKMQIDRTTKDESENRSIVSLIKTLKYHSEKLGRDKMTMLVDFGCFFNVIKGIEDLLKYERSIPQVFKNLKLKQVCLYHQQDFETRFSTAEKIELLDRHGRTVLLLDNS